MMETLSNLCKGFGSGARARAISAAVRPLATGDTTARATFYGLAGSAAAMALYAASEAMAGRPLVVVCDNADDAGYMYHDLTRIAGEEAVMFFPSGYKRHIKYGQVDGPSGILRTEALAAWERRDSLRFMVTYPEALAEQVMPRDQVNAHSQLIRRGDALDMTVLEEKLLADGFNRVEFVYEPGQFAIRGSIVDIFSYASELPVRLDFFGDEVDSIRTFDVETQLSVERIDSATLSANVARTQDGDTARGISLPEFVGEDTPLAVHDGGYCVERVRAIAGESFSANASIADEGDPGAMRQVVDAERFAADFERHPRLNFTAAAAPGDKAGRTVIDFGCTPQGIYHKNFELISQSFIKLLNDGYTLYILSDSDKQIQRLKDIFAERGDDIAFTPVLSTLHEGFVDHARRVCVFTDHQIFDRFHRYNLRSDRVRSGRVALSLKELSQIEPGDYVVHIDHGVGRFGGLIRTTINGKPQEVIKLIYKNDDQLFVSIHSLHKLSKYRGKEGVPPAINRIGSGAWQRLKERTKNKLKDIARDLIRLYAARKEQQGHAFAPDTYLQHELEASFAYEDTPDQVTATAAVKADMESPRPMDRLICGDVGFGKTEIAIRAAFKAVCDSKQVAVLVPTTVLAYQHYNTFRDRLREMPVRVEYLSRARTAAQTRQILKDLAEGKIDILVGTHRIVGKDVRFKDLGMLIIDEEQKFGVAVKEKLKQLKVNVDTITMSATPIPRTLQFSLMGARDLSSITTPPPNRHPIATSVSGLNDDTITEAINFEMSRGGQCFFINNRIEGLYDLERTIRRLIPDCRTLVAHGQMPPEQLEKAIIDFANHDYDVLLATTIIESGVDMPNVNTILVNNAQNFGLSELHQLRGRVGRSNRKAFCYLFVPPGLPLSPVAHRRLQAIESFSDLGSGIHIAMQDLDIRGAGNLLGAEQSGFIADLGYEAYQRILKEAVTELRTEEFADTYTTESNKTGDEQEFVADCIIESDLELLLPYDYVPSDAERIALYQQLDNIELERDLDTFRANLRDRFGPIPAVTEELLMVPRLRRLARRLGIEKVNLQQGRMYIYFVGTENQAYYRSPMFGRILHYAQDNTRRVQIRDAKGRNSFVIADVPGVSAATAILRNILALDSL